jgi:hypothetical protein
MEATMISIAARKIREKHRNGLLVHWVYDRATSILSRMGITIEISITYREGLTETGQPQPRLSDFYCGRATQADLAELGHVRGCDETSDMVARSSAGTQCYLLRHEERIVAFIWFDIGGPPRPRFGLTFGPRDAYVFDAYAVPSYRGLNLLPFLKQQVLQDLQRSGCDIVLTATDVFNRPAQRYKRKLGARPKALIFYIGCSRHFGKAITLYRFRSEPKHADGLQVVKHARVAQPD